MRTTLLPSARRVWPAALLLALAPTIAACGDDDGNDAQGADDVETSASATPTPSAVESSSEATASASTKPPVEVSSQPPAADDNLPAPCVLVHNDDIEPIMGGTFSPGRTDVEDEDEGGTSYLASECSFEQKNVMELSVRIYGAGDYTKGSFSCLQPSDAEGVVEPADGIAGATSGWWKVSSPPDFNGMLRACTPSAIVEVELDYDDGVQYDGDPKSQATQIAELVLSKL